jgi:hypothetical protein
VTVFWFTVDNYQHYLYGCGWSEMQWSLHKCKKARTSKKGKKKIFENFVK